MKKITVLFIALSLIFVINSCSKEEKRGCTDSSSLNYDASATSDDGSCQDLTAEIVGTYLGNLTDTVSTGQTVIPNQQVKVTKIDNSHIQVSSYGSSSQLYSFTASVTPSPNGDGYLLSIPTQTSSGGATLEGSPYGVVGGVTYNGTYLTSGKLLGTATTFDASGTTFVEFYTGIKQ